MMIRGAIWQFPVSLDIAANLKAIMRGLQTVEPETLLVMPEGAISGYAPEPDLVSRATKTQRFVLALNNAAPDQKCPSMIIAPSGHVFEEHPAGPEQRASSDLDLSQISNWVLAQQRTDLFADLEA